MLQELTLRNLLSFGPDTQPLALRPLNVLIGPNGSGKSNLIDLLALLRSTTIQQTFSQRSLAANAAQWLFKGALSYAGNVEAVIECGR